MLRKDIPLPFYFQLSEIIREQIRSGVLKVGDSLPSEGELARCFGVSRYVVRQALGELSKDGLISSRQGKGHLVARQKRAEGWVHDFVGWYGDMVRRGLQPQTRVLELGLVVPPLQVLETLRTPAGSRVLRMSRLRLIEGEPVQQTENYLPVPLCEQLLQEDLTDRSLNATLEQVLGLRVVRMQRSIEVAAADTQTAQLLGLRRRAPVLRVTGVSYLEDETPVDFFEAFYRPDHTRFEVEMVRPSSPASSPDGAEGAAVSRA